MTALRLEPQTLLICRPATAQPESVRLGGGGGVGSTYVDSNNERSRCLQARQHTPHDVPVSNIVCRGDGVLGPVAEPETLLIF